MHGEHTQRFIFTQHAMQVSGVCRNLERCTSSREHGCFHLLSLQPAVLLHRAHTMAAT